MRKAYRLIKEKHKKNAFTGEGARISGGRWNHRGIAVVYTSETLSLAAIELFVHLDVTEAAFPLVYFPVEIPDVIKIGEIKHDDLPGDRSPFEIQS
ncbi:MAG: RES family NAD+ phosphorylase [Nitrospirae bacterium]|nr:RES family NAD+ phosphorylase [Nitrospirota bacterium]